MVLALHYMQKTGQVDPDIEQRFLEKIEVGYQRLLGFEVKSEPGGFDWWGKPPANLFLSAYGLMEFGDMAEVYPVDPGLLARIQRYLISKQAGDGSWSPDGVKGAWSTDMAKGQAYNLTAYVAWCLARTGGASAKALGWLEAHEREAKDAYSVALTALAFLTADPASAIGRRLADRLVAIRLQDGPEVWWTTEAPTSIGARGLSARIETTALAIQALLADGRHTRVAVRALDRLAGWRGSDGRFGTTQSTILALKALLAAEAGSRTKEAMQVRITDGGETPVEFTLPPDSTEPKHVELGDLGATPIALTLTGEGRVRATASRTSWVSWDALPPTKSRLELSVRYPSGDLPVGRRAEAHVVVCNRTIDKHASVVTLEVGIPPGCTVEPEDVKGDGAERVERGETHIVIYLRGLAPREERAFTVPFTPRYALDVVTASSKAYEYYVPEEEVLVPPQVVRAVR